MPSHGSPFNVLACVSLIGLAIPALAADDGFTFLGDYHLGPNASLQVIDGVVAIGGDFDVAINDSSRFDLTSATLQFIGLPGDGPYEIEAMAEDIGFCDLTLPDPGLFSVELLRIGPSRINVAFVDQHDNAPGAGNEALYVETLKFEPNTTLDVRGLNLYYTSIIPANAGQPSSGVTITDSVGGGGVFELGTDSPNPPSLAVTSDNEICDDGSTLLSATIDPGLELDWYTDDCGLGPSNRPVGTFVGTGNPLTVSPTATTVYRALSRNPATGCLGRTCSNAVTVIVHDNPLCTVASTPLVCSDESGLTASVQNAGANTTYDWTVIGGSITGGQNTDTITFTSDDVPEMTISVVVTKTYSDGDGSICVSTCQTTVSTDDFQWTGPDGGSFTDGSNWNPAVTPGTIDPGGDAILENSSGTDNLCIFDDPSATILACNVRISASGSGRQALEIHDGSVLASTIATTVDDGGDILMRGGEIAGGPLINRSDSVTGYGVISSDILNQGRLESRAGRDVTLMLTGSNVTNDAAGLLRTTLGSVLLVQAGAVSQSGMIEIQTLSGVLFSGPFVNSAGGQVNLFGGSLGAAGVTNAVGAMMFGFGTIQSSVDNDGNLVTAADAQIVGDLANDGLVAIQNGLLTVTGSVSGSGTIIGGLGGRDAGAGLEIQGDFDLATCDPAAMDLSSATLWMNGDANGAAQKLEAMAADTGPRGAAPAEDRAFLIGTLRIGPSATTVRLVDRHRNSLTAKRVGREAVHLGRLILEPGATLDLGGLNLYCQSVALVDPDNVDQCGIIIDSVGGGRLITLADRRVGR